MTSRRVPARTVVLAIAIAGALVIGACGDGGGGSEDPGDVVQPTEPAGEGNDFTGSPDSAFCRRTRAAAGDPVLDPFEAGIDAAEVRVRFLALEERFDSLADVAPTELTDGLGRLTAGLDDLSRQLEAVDHDLDRLAESGFDASVFDDPDFASIAARVAAYQQQVCGTG